MKDTFYIGTRGSALALWQANWVKKELAGNNPGCAFELVTIKTTGDKILDVPLAKVGGKGLFVKEIEEALQDERIDIAVHSMKDVPTEILEGLVVGVITKRENPFDVLIAREHKKLADLPRGAVLGTSSLRRQAQLLNFRRDFKIRALRGNLDTRVKKLETENLDGIVVAAAGIVRMGLGEKVSEQLAPSVLLPAIGQGALGIETRQGDRETNEIISVLHHAESAVTVAAERAFLKRLEGGCQVPIAAFARLEGGRLTLEGLIGSIDGKVLIREKLERDPKDAEAAGITLAEALLSAGGRAILNEVYRMGENLNMIGSP
jgi:hydroxymethylbilane synthase